jgi:3-deoxy-D-manno-octulosonic acid (KDO) 8-phosphate synthase
MTRNPVFVLSETLAVEALQKMVQGLFIEMHVNPATLLHLTIWIWS